MATEVANKSWHGTSKSPLNTISLSQAAVLQGRESSKPNETRRREKKERENELNTHDEETRRGLKRPGSSAGVAPKHEKGIKNITKKRRKRRRIKKMSREGKRRERERERESPFYRQRVTGNCWPFPHTAAAAGTTTTTITQKDLLWISLLGIAAVELLSFSPLSQSPTTRWLCAHWKEEEEGLRHGVVVVSLSNSRSLACPLVRSFNEGEKQPPDAHAFLLLFSPPPPTSPFHVSLLSSVNRIT